MTSHIVHSFRRFAPLFALTLSAATHAVEPAYRLWGGGGHTVAIRTADGQVLAWGRNEGGQIGTGDTIERYAPVPVYALDPQATPSVYALRADKVAVGGRHSLAVDRTGQLWAWGKNDLSQLGDGTTQDRLYARRHPSFGQDLSYGRVLDFDGGGNHSVVLAAGNRVYAWGKNTDGQVGNGSTAPSVSAPTSVVGLPETVIITRVAVGDHHSLALDRDGRVWAWGSNIWGQVGLNAEFGDKVTTPVLVTTIGTEIPRIQDVRIVAIAVGGEHSLALDEHKRVWAWGKNLYGQLGVSPELYSGRREARLVDGLATDVVELAAEGPFTVALDEGYDVWTWGSDYFGQLGDGNSGDDMYRPTPGAVLKANGAP